MFVETLLFKLYFLIFFFWISEIWEKKHFETIND